MKPFLLRGPRDRLWQMFRTGQHRIRRGSRIAFHFSKNQVPLPRHVQHLRGRASQGGDDVWISFLQKALGSGSEATCSAALPWGGKVGGRPSSHQSGWIRKQVQAQAPPLAAALNRAREDGSWAPDVFISPDYISFCFVLIFGAGTQTHLQKKNHRGGKNFTSGMTSGKGHPKQTTILR